jgi:flagellar motor protein MotB
MSGVTVTVLAKDLAGRVWQGTQTGLAVWNPGASSWQNMPLPPETSGPVRAIRPEGSLCYVSAATADILILDVESGRWLRRSPPESQVPITGIAVYGTSLVLGTDGQGLWRYQWGVNRWEKLPAGLGASGNFILASASNGVWAWFGTFDGLLALRQDNGKLQDMAAVYELPAGAVTSLACGEQQLLVGTENGLAVLPLSEPQVACQPRRSVILSPPSEVVFDGMALSSAGVKSVAAEFAVQTLPDTWFNANLTLGTPDARGRVAGRWRTEDLPSPSDFYLLRLRVLDQRGQTNTAMAQVVIAPTKPKLTLRPLEGTVNAGLQTVSGTFDTAFASEVIVDPGGLKAHLDAEAGTFQTTVKLEPGSNPVRAKLTDWFGRQTEAVLSVKAAVDVAPETAVQVRTSETGEETLTLNEMLLFDSGSVEIKTSGYPALIKVVDYLNRDKNLQARIEGHTDNVPIHTAQFPDNTALSKGRARAVFDYLVKTQHVAASRLTVQGMGEIRPIAPNRDSAGRAKNRRVEIIVQAPYPEAQ